VTEIVNLLVY